MQFLKTDYHYLTKDFWAHDYGWHFVIAAAFQIVFIVLGLSFEWMDFWHLMLLVSFFNWAAWVLKEICSTVTGKLTRGLLPSSQPDWRDMRMSTYGLLTVDLLLALIHLFAY